MHEVLVDVAALAIVVVGVLFALLGLEAWDRWREK